MGIANQVGPRTLPHAQFLRDYAVAGIVARAARAVRVGRRTFYDWLAEDPQFARLFDEAEQDAIDALELEAHRRAMTGTVEPVCATLPGRHLTSNTPSLPRSLPTPAQ
jgi:hypothetical protein